MRNVHNKQFKPGPAISWAFFVCGAAVEQFHCQHPHSVLSMPAWVLIDVLFK